MTALIIIGGIILFFALLLSFSITLYVCITDQVSIKIGAFGLKFKLPTSPPSEEEKEETGDEKEEKKAKKSSKNDKSSPKKVTENTFAETIEQIFSVVSKLMQPAAKLLSKLRITALSLNMTVCGENSDETAIAFGGICTGIYNLLGQLDNLITLKVKTVNIRPDFVSDEAVYDIKFKVKLRFGSIIFAFFSIIYRMFIAQSANTDTNKIPKQPKINKN